MSYGGFEYNSRDVGFDPMGSSYGGFNGGMDMGGGFNENNNQGSASKNTDKKGSRDRQSLLPMTIKQLHSITEEEGVSKLDGCEVFSVRIVGTIFSVDAHATNIVYRIGDGTGMVECKSFIEREGSGGAKFADCRQNSLVRVNGNIRTFDGVKSLMIYHMAVVNDWNEVTHHMLESVFTHLKNTKGPLANQGAGAAGQSMNSGMNMHAAMAMKQNMSTSVGQVKMENSGHGQIDPRDQLHKRIMEAYHATGSGENGANFQQIIQFLAQKGAPVSLNTLRSEVEALAGDGLLYTTMDENHYKPTEQY